VTHPSSPIEWLHATGTPDRSRLGGKAATLARLARAGQPVPEGFVLGPQAFRQALTRLGVTRPDDRRQECLEALRSVPLGPEVEAAVADAVRRLGSGPLAVRSSALDEDAGDRSFAGQYRSILHVSGLTAVLEAVREIWASYFEVRVAAYRGESTADARHREVPAPVALRGRRRRWRRNPPRPFHGGMAVLVQRMVDARTSGILFTANPVTGSPREMTLEASEGLCDGLASGAVHPDLWVCARPAKPAQDPLVVVEQTPAPGRREPLLGDDEVQRVADLGLSIEALFGPPQDIEWSLDRRGRPWILQSRPITSLEQSITRQRRSNLLWTQRFSGERWTEQSSPMGWSVIQPVLHHFIEWQDASARYLHGSSPTTLYRGVPYFNISIFRHLVFRLPGMPPIQFLLEFFPPEEQEDLQRRRFYLPNLGLVASIFGQVISERRWRRYQFNFLTNHRVWERFLPRFLDRIDELDEGFDDPVAGLRQYRRARDLIYEYVEIHLLSLLFANLSYQLLGTGLQRWLGDHDHTLRAALTSAPNENRTVAGHKALWKLAALAQQIPAVNAAILTGDTPPNRDELSSLPDSGPFVDALDAFLDEYGHRSAASWEIFATRWSENPAAVMGMIRSYLEGGIHTDPYLNEERHQQAFLAAMQQLDDQLHATTLQRLVPWKAALGSAAVDLTRNYMRLRENQRFHFDQLLFQVKRILLREGELLVERGVMDAAEDIAWLEIDELHRLVNGALDPGEARDLVGARRLQAAEDLRADHPEFLVAEGVPLATELDDRRMLTGMGISPGRVTGTVRVLRDLSETPKLQRGDILVTRATDPGWTPLFLTAGGLVMELGSLLSHGAVVAREYALPAVVNVANATRRLQDGQEVVLDGAKGLVYVL